MQGKRQIWIYDIKIFACILVVLGHFYSGLVGAGIAPEDNMYLWFKQTIYMFHVPLFFICSGFLYQNYNKIDSFDKWKSFILKKFIILGPPYFLFSVLTWLLKTVFASEINYQAKELFHSLLFDPISPYWYLYVLFFMFLFIPCIGGKKTAIVFLLISAFLKCLSSCVNLESVYLLEKMAEHSIWFITGMVISYFSVHNDIKKRLNLKAGFTGLIIFLLLSAVFYEPFAEHRIVDFVLGMTACLLVLTIFICLPANDKYEKIVDRLSKYTMPVYLMHTIFSAGLRSVLLMFNISGIFTHVLGGLFISFIGPMLTFIIYKKVRVIFADRS